MTSYFELKSMYQEQDDPMPLPNRARCTHCGAFISYKPTFDELVTRYIPHGYLDGDQWISAGEKPYEEYVTEWICKRCNWPNNPCNP